MPPGAEGGMPPGAEGGMPPGVKPSEATDQLMGGASSMASMYAPPGLDILGGVAKDKATSVDIPNELTSVPNIGAQAPTKEGKPGGEKKAEIIPEIKNPLGKYQKSQQKKNENMWETLTNIFKTIADATGISWLMSEINKLIAPQTKTPEEVAEEKKAHLRFQSPIKITKGFSGSLGAGSQSLIFPQLDPDKFREGAVTTGKEMFATSASYNQRSSAFNSKKLSESLSAIKLPELTIRDDKSQNEQSKETNSPNLPNIIFEKGAIQLTSANADELEQQMTDILKRAVRRAQVEE
jgi:hypothetical protein